MHALAASSCSTLQLTAVVSCFRCQAKQLRAAIAGLDDCYAEQTVKKHYAQSKVQSVASL